MKTYSEFRAEARQALKGHWNEAALFFFVYFIIASIISAIISGSFSFIPVVGSIPVVDSLVSSLVLLPMGYALYTGFLRMKRGEDLQVGWLFKHFNSRVWVTLLLQCIYTVLWYLLLIIPGIVKSYSYALTPLILHDEPELQNNAAIERSMEMMKGNKMSLFVLDLTFLGWYLLGILTLGIAYFWIVPYHYTARVAFYESLKAGDAFALSEK